MGRGPLGNALFLFGSGGCRTRWFTIVMSGTAFIQSFELVIMSAFPAVDDIDGVRGSEGMLRHSEFVIEESPAP